MVKKIKKIHTSSVVIDALGGFGYAYTDILAGGIHATNVTLASWHESKECSHAGLLYGFHSIYASSRSTNPGVGLTTMPFTLFLAATRDLPLATQ